MPVVMIMTCLVDKSADLESYTISDGQHMERLETWCAVLEESM